MARTVRRGKAKGDIRTLADAYLDASGREAKAQARRALRPLVYDMRQGGASWGDIVEAVGWEFTDSEGRLQFLYFQEDAERNPELQITFRTRAELGKKVVRARDNQLLSWGKIAAYARDADGNEVSESLVKAVYEETTGESVVGNRIGKGGRLVGDSKPATRQATRRAATKTKAAAKPAKAEKPTRRARTKPEPAPAAAKTTGKRRAAKAAPVEEAPATRSTRATTRKGKVAPPRAPRRPARQVAE